MGNVVTDDDLILSSLPHHTDHARDAFYHFVIYFSVVPQHKAQACHTVNNTFYIPRSSDRVQYLLSNARIIHIEIPLSYPL